MANKAAVPFLVGMMLLTGVCNTLLTKYQDNQCVRNCDDPNPKNHKLFEQPVIQTAQMFVGEAGCWLVVALLSLWQRFSAKRGGGNNNNNSHTAAEYEPVSTSEADADADARSIHSTTALNPTGGNGTAHKQDDDDDDRRALASEETLKGTRVLLLALPAICDILGTTLMNCGLLLVAASIYQMTRGALVLFVGLFSVVFLKRKLHLFQWVSLGGVVLGVGVVGLAGAIWPDQHKAKAAAAAAAHVATTEVDAAALLAIGGVAMIAGAQIFTATQFVLEEWLLERSTIDPIRVVGWEGLFGFLVTLLGMVVLHFAIGRTEAGKYGPFDMAEGWKQWTANPKVLVSSILIMFSIGGFNFFGLSVTRSVSATARSTIDTCRTLFIWIVSLGLGWETFKWLQILGFVLLVYFTFLFNGIVSPPFEFLKPKEEVGELLPEEPIEHI